MYVIQILENDEHREYNYTAVNAGLCYESGEWSARQCSTQEYKTILSGILIENSYDAFVGRECVHGKCYNFSDNMTTWLEARQFCLDKGADHAVPFLKANNDYLYSGMSKKGMNKAFIRLFKTAPGPGSKFYTTNGRLPVFIYWGDLQHSNWGGNENCVEMIASSKYYTGGITIFMFRWSTFYLSGSGQLQSR